jgi:hypothetical protein
LSSGVSIATQRIGACGLSVAVRGRAIFRGEKRDEMSYRCVVFFDKEKLLPLQVFQDAQNLRSILGLVVYRSLSFGSVNLLETIFASSGSSKKSDGPLYNLRSVSDVKFSN